MQKRLKRNELTVTDQMFLYLEHCIIEMETIRHKDEILERLIEYSDDLCRMTAWAALLGIPLYDKDGTNLWAIWPE